MYAGDGRPQALLLGDDREPSTDLAAAARCAIEDSSVTDYSTLKANPPKRIGRQTPNGWSGEPEKGFEARMDAYRAALERAKESK